MTCVLVCVHLLIFQGSSSLSVFVHVCVFLPCTIQNPVRLHVTTSLKVISAHRRRSQQAPPSALTPLIDWWSDLQRVIKYSVASYN